MSASQGPGVGEPEASPGASFRGPPRERDTERALTDAEIDAAAAKIVALPTVSPVRLIRQPIKPHTIHENSTEM